MKPIVWPTGTLCRPVFWVPFREEGFSEAVVVARIEAGSFRSSRVCVQLPPLLP